MAILGVFSGNSSRFRRKWRWYHGPHGSPYHRENSNRGDAIAKRLGLDGNSHDMQKDKNGTIWNAHWQDVFAKDGFHDPFGIYKPGDLLKDLDEPEIRRLRAIDGDNTYHIRTEAEAIINSANIGLKFVDAEAKAGNGWTVADFKYLKSVAREHHIPLVISSMRRGILVKARLAGCRTRFIRSK